MSLLVITSLSNLLLISLGKIPRSGITRSKGMHISTGY